LSATKSLLLMPFRKVATLPAGRKTKGLGAGGDIDQSMTAELLFTVTVSTPGVARL